MNDDANTNEDRLPSFDKTTPEGTAKAILWTMDYFMSWDAPHPRSGNHVLRSQQELADLWTMQGGDTANEPHVDFSRHLVICVFVDEGEYEECPMIERIEERS